MFTDKVARALLEAHERECRETRARTDRQFEAVKDSMNAFSITFQQRFSELDGTQTKRHEENQKDIASIRRYIWLAAGGATTLLFLADHGHLFTKLLEFTK